MNYTMKSEKYSIFMCVFIHCLSLDEIPGISDFGDAAGYAGFVPSERYLFAKLNRAIEADGPDADQHTSCLETDDLAVDDSHKAWSTFSLRASVVLTCAGE
jgi:hypothetical protein